MELFRRIGAFFSKIRRKRLVLFFVIATLAVAGILTAVLFLIPSAEEPSEEVSAPVGDGEETLTYEESDTKGEALPPATAEPKTEEKNVFIGGIDVSRWQGNIDWAKVKKAGVGFAMIRIGAYSEGEFVLDPKAVYNLQQAEKNGVLAGVYFYSGAKLPQDARKEAAWVLDQIAGFAISYPVVLDWEMDSAKRDVTAAVCTDTALAFMQEIENAGYEAMLYTPQDDFENPAMWQKERILGKYPVWVARYSDPAYPAVSHPDGNTDYAMWQYSDKGSVSGINGNVDLDVAYFEREFCSPKDESRRPSDEDPEEDFKQVFEAKDIRLTAKIEVNLRSRPSMESTVVAVLKKGEFLQCTGVSDMGWARLIYEGEPVYAVYSMLSEKVTEEVVDPAEGHSFAPVNDEVTAKEYVNLRSAPVQEEGNVVAVLNRGEYILRTGLGDKGWDRLEYQGQTVFAVSSMLETKELTGE